MSKRTPAHIDFVTEEYAEKLARFADDHDVSREAAEQAFRAHCEGLQPALKDDTPAGVIRRIAFHKLEWQQLTEDPVEVSEPSVKVETDRAVQG